MLILQSLDAVLALVTSLFALILATEMTLSRLIVLSMFRPAVITVSWSVFMVNYENLDLIPVE